MCLNTDLDRVGVGGLQLKNTSTRKCGRGRRVGGAALVEDAGDVTIPPDTHRSRHLLSWVICDGAPCAHKDRTKHDRDGRQVGDAGGGSVVWLLARLAIMVVGLAFGGMAMYVHKAWMANHPELPDPSTLPPRRRRESSFKAPRLPKMLRRKDKPAKDGPDDDDVPLLLDRQADDDSDKGVELTERGKPESKAPDSDLSDSEDEAKESTPLRRDEDSGPRRRAAARRRGDDDIDPPRSRARSVIGPVVACGVPAFFPVICARLCALLGIACEEPPLTPWRRQSGCPTS